MHGTDARRRFLATIPLWPAWILFATGIVKLAQTGVFWLRTATWKPQTGVAALSELGFAQAKVNSWLVAPRSWIGLHKIAAVFLRWPAFLLYFLAAGLAAVAALPLVDRLESRWARSDTDRRFWQ
jgi:hypothetical protein